VRMKLLRPRCGKLRHMSLRDLRLVLTWMRQHWRCFGAAGNFLCYPRLSRRATAVLDTPNCIKRRSWRRVPALVCVLMQLRWSVSVARVAHRSSDGQFPYRATSSPSL
jgi:hypothetical protein